MPKSLGQIHTCDFNYEQATSLVGTPFLCDSSAKLSTQFNRNIRMLQTYKWVGADLVVQLPEDIGTGTQSDRVIIKGRMRYFAPTKGRCDALRDAFSQFKENARYQAVSPMKNKLFDFRVLPRAKSEYLNAVAQPSTFFKTSDLLYNLTTMDGTNELAMIAGNNPGNEVFTSYNENVRPQETNVTDTDFSSGLTTQLGTLVTQTDFVLDEGLIQAGNPNIADVKMEEIPFTLSYDGTARRTMSLQWRPDPALFVSVLGGFVEIIIDEATADGAAGGVGALDGFEVDCSLHWAGWKSIAKPRSSRSRKFPNNQQKKIAREIKGVVTSKEAKTLIKILRKMM